MKPGFFPVAFCIVLFLCFSHPVFGSDFELEPGEISPQNEFSQTNASYREKVSRGLKEALAIGVKRAVKTLGKEKGFLENESVKIPLPEHLKLAETYLRKAGQGDTVDEFIVSMNQAASEAVKEVPGIFITAIEKMTITDAVNILNGEKHATTQYFQKHTSEKLNESILPIVKKATESTQVTTYYKKVKKTYDVYAKPVMDNPDVRKLASVLTEGAIEEKAPEESFDLDRYITQKSMDGLFFVIAEEEEKIRKNPKARVTDLLETIFGSRTE